MVKLFSFLSLIESFFTKSIVYTILIEKNPQLSGILNLMLFRY